MTDDEDISVREEWNQLPLLAKILVPFIVPIYFLYRFLKAVIQYLRGRLYRPLGYLTFFSYLTGRFDLTIMLGLLTWVTALPTLLQKGEKKL